MLWINYWDTKRAMDWELLVTSVSVPLWKKNLNFQSPWKGFRNSQRCIDYTLRSTVFAKFSSSRVSKENFNSYMNYMSSENVPSLYPGLFWSMPICPGSGTGCRLKMNWLIELTSVESKPHARLTILVWRFLSHEIFPLPSGSLKSCGRNWQNIDYQQYFLNLFFNNFIGV